MQQLLSRGYELCSLSLCVSVSMFTFSINNQNNYSNQLIDTWYVYGRQNICIDTHMTKAV